MFLISGNNSVARRDEMGLTFITYAYVHEIILRQRISCDLSIIVDIITRYILNFRQLYQLYRSKQCVGTSNDRLLFIHPLVRTGITQTICSSKNIFWIIKFKLVRIIFYVSIENNLSAYLLQPINNYSHSRTLYSVNKIRNQFSLIHLLILKKNKYYQ